MKLKTVLTGAVALTGGVLVAGYAIIASLDVQQVADFAKQEVKAATGRDLAVDGQVALQVSLVPSIDLQEVRFANAPWGSRPDMVTLRRLEIEVELLPLLFGDVVVKRLVAVAPDILLETDAEGRGNWEFEEAAGTAGEAAPAETADESGPVSLPDVQDFRIEGGQLTMVDATLGETLSLEVTEAVGAVPAGGGARSLRLVAAYNGNPVRLEGSYAGLPALLSGATGPLDLTLQAGGVTLAVSGSAGDLTGDMAADVAVSAEGESLAGLSSFLGTELPALGPFKLSGDVKAANQVIDFSRLRLEVGGSDLGGNATLDLAGARPALKAALLSKLLDLNDFSGAGAGAGGGVESGGGQGAAAADSRIFSETPLPLEGLRALDAQVKLDAEVLRLTPILDLNEVRLTLALKGGNLTVEPLAAVLAGGSLDGRLALAGAKAEPDVALVLTGRDIDFGELLKRAEVSDEVGGQLELDVDLKGRGASPHAIASGLGGYVQAVSEEGTIDNSMLRFLSAGLSDITGPLFGQSERTRLECFVTRFDVEQGQAKSRALVLDSGAFAVAGRGGLDLADERVNLAFDTQTSEPSLASLAVPFKVVGPLADPAIVPDPIGAAAGVVGTVGNVAETGGNIVGGAVDAVGGLLGTGPIIGRIGDNQTLCGQALAAIGRGGAAGADSGSGQSAPASGGVADDAGKALKDVGEGIEEGLKSLFGN